MKSFFGLAILTLGIALGASSATAQTMSSGNPMVGGAAMYKTKNIVENAVNSADHTTLVAAVKAAGLVDTLASPGPFTVFAPVNGAFAALPAGTVETLLKPENKGTLAAILTYHVVPGTVTAAELVSRINAGGGSATTAPGAWRPPSPSNSSGNLRDGMGFRCFFSHESACRRNPNCSAPVIPVLTILTGSVFGTSIVPI